MNAKKLLKRKAGRFLVSCSVLCALAPGAAQAQLRNWSFLVKSGSTYKEARVSFNGVGNAPSVSIVDTWKTPPAPGDYKHYDTYYTGQGFKALTRLDKSMQSTTSTCDDPSIPMEWEHQSLFFRRDCDYVGLISGGKFYDITLDAMCLNAPMTGSDYPGLTNASWAPNQNVKQRFYPVAARFSGAVSPTVTYYYLEKPFGLNYQLRRKTFNGSTFSAATTLGTIPAGTASSFILGEDKYPGTEAQYMGEMEISPNGRYVAFSITYRSYINFGVSSRSRTIIYLYDNTLNTFTQYSESYTEFTTSTPTGTLPFVLTGLEFNATSDRLYFTFNGAPTTTVPTGAVGYFSSLTGGLSGTNLTFITNSLDYRSSHIELGLDNKLYLHHYDGSGLARIEESTSTITASALSFAPYAVPLNHEYVIDEANPGAVDFRIRTMPKQSDGYNYIGNEASDASCCATQAVYNALDVTVNPGTVVWNGNNYPDNTYYIKNKLTVKAGARLVLQTLRLEMGKDAQIVVEPGAVLEVNTNTLITSHCPGTTWKGILAQGNSAFAQDPYPTGQTIFYRQGVVRINGGTIENAVTGITAGDPDDANKLGALVTGTGGTIRNCQTGISFTGNYSFTNKSNFVSCTFLVDRPLNASLPFYVHALISGNTGIVFTGCQFTNANPYAQDYSELGYGIQAGNSVFHVKPRCSGVGCPTYTPCRFTGLRTGIYSLNFFGPATTTFSVNAAEFDGCHRGIESAAINNLEISNCTFKVGNIRTDNPGYTDGIFIGGTSLNYKVTENKFIAQPMLIQTKIVGITASHTGASENRIYRNYFTNMGQSALSNGTNRNTSGGSTSLTGLQFVCNQFNNAVNYASYTEYDIAIVRTDANSGVRYYQGNFTSPTSRSAGNLFSRNNFNTASDVFSDVNHPVVYHYLNAGTQQPLYYTPTLVNPVLANTQETCPSIYGGLEGLIEIGGEKNAQRADYEAAQSQLAFYQDQLGKLENGAELTRLLNDARALQNPGQLRARLLEASPYLDAEVLNLTVDKIDVLTPAVLFEILSANPDGLRDETMFTRLGEEGRLPGWMIDELRRLRGTVSAKTLLQAVITHYASEKTMAAYAFMNQNLGNAETPADRVAVAEWMGKLNTAEGDMALAFDRASQGNWKEAEALLDAMPALYGTENNADAKALQTRFRSLWDGTAVALKNGRTITRLNESEKAFLRSLADGNEYEPAGYIARGLLTLNGEPRRNDPKFPGETDKPVVTAKPAVSTDMAGVSWSVYPNPASDLVNVRWSIAGLGDGAEIAVFDVTGRNVFRKNIAGEEGTLTVNVDTFSAGTYTLRLQAGGKTFGTKQLVVY